MRWSLRYQDAREPSDTWWGGIQVSLQLVTYPEVLQFWHPSCLSSHIIIAVMMQSAQNFKYDFGVTTFPFSSLFNIEISDDKSALAQVMACCHQATSHYLGQCWRTWLSPYDITRPQWVNTAECWFNKTQYIMILGDTVVKLQSHNAH